MYYSGLKREQRGGGVPEHLGEHFGVGRGFWIDVSAASTATPDVIGFDARIVPKYGHAMKAV